MSSCSSSVAGRFSSIDTPAGHYKARQLRWVVKRAFLHAIYCGVRGTNTLFEKYSHADINHYDVLEHVGVVLQHSIVCFVCCGRNRSA